MKTAIFPGSFNPFTIGHANIVERALKLFDKVYIGIARNPEKVESDFDTIISDIKKRYQDNNKVEVLCYEKLTAQICQEKNIDAIIRGVRNNEDLQYENEINSFNYTFFGIETIYLLADPKLKKISSTMMRELAKNGIDVYPNMGTDINGIKFPDGDIFFLDTNSNCTDDIEKCNIRNGGWVNHNDSEDEDYWAWK